MRLIIELDYSGFRGVRGNPANEQEREETNRFARALTDEITRLGIAAQGFGKFIDREKAEIEKLRVENEELNRRFEQK